MSFNCGTDDIDRSINFEDLHFHDQEEEVSVSNKESNSSLQSKDATNDSEKSTVASSLIGRQKRTSSILKQKDATKIAANLVGKKGGGRVSAQVLGVCRTLSKPEPDVKPPGLVQFRAFSQARPVTL